MTQLSQHFTLEEFTRSTTGQRLGLDNTPTEEQISNLTHTARCMEAVRAIFNVPIHVDSAFRSPAVNAAVGGSLEPPSDHLEGWAVDFIIPGEDNYEAACFIRDSGVQYDRMILEYGWIHMSFKPGFRQINETKLSKDTPYLPGLREA